MAVIGLNTHAVAHGGLQPLQHPELGVEITGETAVRYLRFRQSVRLERLELQRSVYGRWVPAVPTHPAHLLISVLDSQTNRWHTVREVDLPYDPRTAGEGLSQAMGVEAMEAHFARVLADPPYVIPLDGLETDHLRVVCDREHPMWSNHGEVNGGPYHVPFGILHPLRAFGEPLGAPAESVYQPILRQGTIRPAAPAGMRLTAYPHLLQFASDRLSVGFSLRRPLLLHFGWDALGKGQAGNNRHVVSMHTGSFVGQGFPSGPILRTLTGDFAPRQWTGAVEVEGNRVCYRDLHCCDGLRFDATFTVEPDRLYLELAQYCDRELPVLEAEAWRLSWDLTAGMTAAAAEPTLLPGRNGDVRLPALWASDSVGCLALQQTGGDDARLQVESYRELTCTTGGLQLAPRPAADACLVVPAGKRAATFELAVAELEPNRPQDASPASDGIRRGWATVFACFRAEYRGFSNNAASCNCHLSQLPPIDLAAHTAAPPVGPDPRALGRFTIGRALLDGGGYGYFRNLYLDSDPVLVSAAGRLHQVAPDAGWLAQVTPGLEAAVTRMAGEIGAEGLVVCRDLSGNAGSFRWSSNGMDVVGFGHLDAYVNALSYRAFRNATALFTALGQAERATQCRAYAAGIRAAYATQLLNPATGWVAGWRSRDGELHDYAFLWVNGVALAYGLLDDDDARRALQGLEDLREELGMGAGHLGVPLNLLPIRADDHMLPRIPGMAQPTFETYTDGSYCTQAATYYLRALSCYGFTAQARKLADELEAGYAAGFHNGGIGSGVEFRSWDGVPTGYEGTLIGCFGPLYAIAIEQGQLAPTDPEWWPADIADC